MNGTPEKNNGFGLQDSLKSQSGSGKTLTGKRRMEKTKKIWQGKKE